MVARARTLSLSINWGSTSLVKTPSTRSTVTTASIGPPSVLRKHSQTRRKDAHAPSNNTMDSEKQKEHPRRLSRRSPSSGAHRWRFPSRKNSRQQENDDDDDKDGDMRDRKGTDADSIKDSDDGRPMSMLEKQHQQQQLQNLSRFGASSGDLHRSTAITIIPEPLPKYTEDLLRQIPGVLPPVRTNYHLNNPKGPKYYKNHHLIEPHTRMPTSSTFSPSFPAMTNNGAIVMDSLRIPGPSRSRSNSPLPSPNASQTRLGDGLTQIAPGTRSRKVSQTAHDNVDMLDASDPWGQNWHHHSPYDVEPLGGPSQFTAQDPQIRSGGSRSASTTNLNKPVVPSPLSKSTSAVNLAEPIAPVSLPRSVSTRGGYAGPIQRDRSGGSGGPNPVSHVKAQSAPVTPLEDRGRSSQDRVDASGEAARAVRRKLSKRGRMSTAPPAITPTAGNSSDSHERDAVLLRPTINGSTEKAHRRTSMLDKISKKFSLLRNKPINDPTKRYSSSSPTKEHSHPESVLNPDPRRLSKRVPPPPAQTREDRGNRSSVSLDIEMPLTTGRLTIANPDTPSSGTTSPINIRSSLLHSQSSGQPEYNEDSRRSRHESESPVPRFKRTASPLRMADEDEYEVPRLHDRHSRRLSAAENEVEIQSQPSLQQLRPEGAPMLPSLHLSPGRLSLALSATSSRPPPLPEKDDRVYAFVNPATLTDSPVEEAFPADAIPEPHVEKLTPPSSAQLEVPTDAIPRTASQSSLAKLSPPKAQATSFSADTAFSRLSTIVNPPTPHVVTSPIPATPAALPDPMPIETTAATQQVVSHRRLHSNERNTQPPTTMSRSTNQRSSVDIPPSNTSSTELNSKRDSRREERSRNEERRERSSRHEEKQRPDDRSRREERFSRYEERAKYDDRARWEERSKRDSSEKERTSRYEDKNRHDERTRDPSFEKEKAKQDKVRREDVPKYADREQPQPEERPKQDPNEKEKSSRRERRMTTEKFKLIRTPSDNIRMASDAIPVGEEQWTLVETTGGSRREKRERNGDEREKEKERSKNAEKEKDRERRREKDRSSPEKNSSRRDSKRDDKYASVRSDPNHVHSSTSRHREERHRSTITRAAEVFDQPIKHQLTSNTDRRNSTVATHGQSGSRAEKDRPSERRGRREERPYASDPRSSYVNVVNDTIPSEAGHASAGRRSSNKRPVSEVPAIGDSINSLTARERWESDRLFKGKSTVIEHENRPYIPSVYDPRYSAFSINGSIASYPVIDASSVYGSTHTGYMVQSPFSGHYAIPVAPPPIMSPSSMVYPAYFPAYPAYGEDVPPFPATDPRSPQNPLPEPPRQSVYSPEPLRQGRPGSVDDPTTPEYWNVYAGITTH